MPFKRLYLLFLIVPALFLSCRKSYNRMGANTASRKEMINVVAKESSGDYASKKEVSVQELLHLKMSSSKKGILLTRIGYISSYNRGTKCPNWVAWHLTAEHTEGLYPREGVPYYADDGTVYGIGHVTPETCKNQYIVDLEVDEPRQHLEDWTREYNMSHGHMCPAGDNKWDKAAINQSFLLTNMCPQDERLNSGGWNTLEDKCRKWARKYGDIYIVTGPIFYEGARRSMGKNKIGIPDAFFKVVLCVNGAPKAIGFIYQNNSSSQSMKDCIHSVDEVEEIAGMDFFYSLTDSIEGEVEAMADLSEW